MTNGFINRLKFLLKYSIDKIFKPNVNEINGIFCFFTTTIISWSDSWECCAGDKPNTQEILLHWMASNLGVNNYLMRPQNLIFIHFHFNFL